MRFEPRGGLRSRIRAGRGRTRFVGDGRVLWPVAHAQCGEQARDAALQRAVQDDRLALGPDPTSPSTSRSRVVIRGGSRIGPELGLFCDPGSCR